jgi:hypothetical protein
MPPSGGTCVLWLPFIGLCFQRIFSRQQGAAGLILPIRAKIAAELIFEQVNLPKAG